MKTTTEAVMIAAMTVLAIAIGDQTIEGIAFGALLVRLFFRGYE